MSRARTRPTREETRQQLLVAAARVFVAKGIGSTTIEDICDEAGFTRGAFYSNFGAKDDLVLALLELHLEANQSEIERLFGESATPEAFIEAMDEPRRLPVEVGDPSVLSMELTLYAMRNPENRPRLVARQRQAIDFIADYIVRIADAEGLEIIGGVEDAANLLMAFDSGLLLQAIIDPERHDPRRWSRTVLTLHRLWAGGSTQG